jgi:hypothetical protein
MQINPVADLLCQISILPIIKKTWQSFHEM